MNRTRSLTDVYRKIESQKPFMCHTCGEQDYALTGEQYKDSDISIELRCITCDCSNLCLKVDDYRYVTHTYVEQGRRVCVYTFYDCDLSKNPHYIFGDDDDGSGIYYLHAIRQEPTLAFNQKEIR